MKTVAPTFTTFAAAFGFLIVAGCSSGVQKPEPTDPVGTPTERPVAAAGYPDGYTGWSQFASSPATRKESREYRELHYNDVARQAGATGQFPAGSVLVKAQHSLVGGRKGRLLQIAVMRKATGGDYGGWQFEVYDPKTLQRTSVDADVCAICHTQRASQDFVFSDRSNW